MVATGSRREVDECPALPLGCQMLRAILPERQPSSVLPGNTQSHGKRLGPLCRGQEARALLPGGGPALPSSRGFASLPGLFPTIAGACALLFPDERPSFQQRVLESWGRTGVCHCDKMKIPGFPPEAAWPAPGGGVVLPRGPAGGRAGAVKTLTFFHLRPRTFRSGRPICTWLWFGLSRERSNWPSFKCFTGIQIPFSFSGGKPS